MKRFCLCIILLIAALHGRCQNASNVYFYIIPSDALISVDGSPFATRSDTMLTEGMHVISYKKANYITITDTILVKSPGVNVLRKKLQPTTEITAYKEKCRQNNVKRNVITFLPLAAGGLFTFLSFNHYYQLNNDAEVYYTKAIAAKEEIETLVNPMLIMDAQERYYENKSLYEAKTELMRKEQKRGIIIGTASVVTTAALYYVTRLMIKDPDFNASQVSWSGMTYHQEMLQTGITVKL